MYKRKSWELGRAYCFHTEAPANKDCRENKSPGKKGKIVLATLARNELSKDKYGIGNELNRSEQDEQRQS
jgi:hypothetical protein